MSTLNNKKVSKIISFLTNMVFIYFVIGVFLIITGQTNLLGLLIPKITPDHPINPIFKTIGGALIGSGVFTVVIKSKEYSQVFSNIIGEIVWSKKFIEKRDDKREIWSMVSKLLYEEKFPLISDLLQEIIANNYLPTESMYYIDNYDLFINVTDIDTNFWCHHETSKFIIKPSDKSFNINHKMVTTIDLPNQTLPYTDQSSFAIESILVNDKEYLNKTPEVTQDNNLLKHTLSIDLCNQDEYKIIIKRRKIMDKKSNLDKKFFAPFIIHNMKTTLIMPKDEAENVVLHKMGTVNEHILEEDQINANTRIMSWNYIGLILPNQGHMIIFK